MQRLRKSALGLSFIINICIFAGLMLAFRPCYETSDDMYMNEFANGIFGRPENHLVFINYIMGCIIQGLYELIPIVNWYAAVQYISVFVSFIVIAYIFIQYKGLQLGGLLSAIVITVFGYQGYIRPQFSKTAGMLVLAGALLIFFAFKSEVQIWKKVLVGVLMMLAGGLFRDSVFWLCLLMVFPIGVVEFLRDFLKYKFKCVKKYVIIVMVFGITLGGFILTNVYHDAQYQKEQEWADYLAWNEALSPLIDGFFPYYEDDWQLYQELGISEKDLRYYEDWHIADVEQLSTETLTRLGAAKEAYWVSLKTRFVNFFSVFPMAFLRISVFPYCMLILTFLVLQAKKKNYFAYITETGALFMAYMYMYMSGRVLYNRIDVIVWMGAILACIYLCEPADGENETRKRGNRNILAAMQVCVVLYLCITNTSALRSNYDAQYEKDIRVRQEAISSDKEHLYLCTADVLGTGFLHNPFYIGEVGELSNYYVLGSWTVNTPVTNGVLQNYGVENPYRDAIDNDKVYIIDIINPERLEQYIQENYSENAVLKLDHQAGAYNVYRVETK